MDNIYEKCPVLKNDTITLRKLELNDAEELLKCYSDIDAVKFFNNDNCHGDDFHFTTIKQIADAVNGWLYCYDIKDFVRMTIINNDSSELIGTVEMFNRGQADGYGIHGILRIDLRSSFEKEKIICAIIDLADKYFFKLFSVDFIMTKAISDAHERIKALNNMGYMKAVNFELENYYYKKCTNHDI